MPYKSDQQRKFMHAVHPEIAKHWDKGESSVTGRKESPSQQGKRKTHRSPSRKRSRS